MELWQSGLMHPVANRLIDREMSVRGFESHQLLQNAPMAKLVDALDLKFSNFGCSGSNPGGSTKKNGGVAEWLIAAVLKTVGQPKKLARGFESHHLLQNAPIAKLVDALDLSGLKIQ